MHHTFEAKMEIAAKKENRKVLHTSPFERSWGHKDPPFLKTS
jgi:hypothetical protein